MCWEEGELSDWNIDHKNLNKVRILQRQCYNSSMASKMSRTTPTKGIVGRAEGFEDYLGKCGKWFWTCEQFQNQSDHNSYRECLESDNRW